MTGLDGATPLIALDAIALDLETTGLNPATARVVEIAALRVNAHGAPDTAFVRRVNPGEPIPASATAIHGFDDASVAAAPPFKAVWPQLADTIGHCIVIGHSLGFDLAILQRECRRASLPERQWRTLDIRLLAEIAEPNLPGHSLEQLAAFLLEMAERIIGKGAVELPMSRQDIADYLGLTIETVSRTLTQFAGASTIELLASRRIVLRNRSALSQLNA